MPFGSSAGSSSSAASASAFSAASASASAALSARLDSMEQLLRHGDEILIDRGSRFERDGVHVVRMGDTLMVKRLASAGAGRIALLSQNLAYPPVEVGLDEIEVLGRVVWKSGRL